MGTVRFEYVVDPYGEALLGQVWGDRVTINAIPVYRKRLADGAKRYLVTNHMGGSKSAAVALWKEPEEPIFWGECRDEAGCEIVMRTLASVTMRSGDEECRHMLASPATISPSTKQAKLAPPPPPPPLSEREACAKLVATDA